MINVCEMLELTAGKFPDKVAFSDPDSEITFRDLLINSQKIATYLINNDYMNDDEHSILFFMEKCVPALPVMFGGV